MNSQELEQSWSEVCTRIKNYDDIDVSQINAFFSRLHPQAMSPGFLALTADNDFIKSWVERHYLQHIMRGLEEQCGVPFNIVIEVDLREAPEQVKPVVQTPIVEEAPKKEESAPVQPARSTVSKSDLADKAQELMESPNAYDKIEGAPATHSFENFVIGDSNRMAYSMAVAVAEEPGKAHLNPLFIYGKSGLGKTHLLRSIQNYIGENYHNYKVVYADSAQLLNDYVDAAIKHDRSKSSYSDFKKRYEEADVLLIDDVQWLQHKPTTLEMVFQLFNILSNQGKQIVLSADRAPKNIDIDERYKSRFNQGVTVDIQPPEIETKLGIIRSLIEDFRQGGDQPQFTIDDEIQRYIAEISSSNVRELKSAVTRVVTNIIYTNRPVSLDDVKVLLENHFSGGPSKRLTVADIQAEVENFYKVSHADLIGKKRSRNIVHARQVAIYLCRSLLDIPYNDIGKKFNRDHSTVMYCVNNVEQKARESRDCQEELESIRHIIREA